MIVLEAISFNFFILFCPNPIGGFDIKGTIVSFHANSSIQPPKLVPNPNYELQIMKKINSKAEGAQALLTP